MRVFLLVFPSSLFMPPVVEHVVVSSRFEVVGVGAVEPRNKGSRQAWIRAQMGYWGLWGTAWIAAATMARKLPALLRFPRVFRRLSSVAETCSALEIPYQRVADPNDPTFVSKLRELEVDVVISFQKCILGSALLATPKVACLNVHTGILPGYRGMKPVFWMQSRREPEMGVTVHTMGERLDTGRIVVQRRWKRRAGSTVIENQLWSYRCAAHCIVEAVEKLGAPRSCQVEEISDSSPCFKAPTRKERDLALSQGTRLF